MQAVDGSLSVWRGGGNLRTHTWVWDADKECRSRGQAGMLEANCARQSRHIADWLPPAVQAPKKPRPPHLHRRERRLHSPAKLQRTASLVLHFSDASVIILHNVTDPPLSRWERNKHRAGTQER